MLTGLVQDALSRISSLLHTLFEASEDAIFLMDGMRFVDCNPATLRMFGCSAKEEILGQTPFAFSPLQQPDGAASAEKAAQLVTAAMDGVPIHFDWRHCRLDRTEFEVEVRLSRFMAEDTSFLVAVVNDITARKRAEEALRRQMQSAELVNQILGRCTLYEPSLFDAHIKAALQELATFLGVEHAYFFMASPDHATYSCTHEWCNAGVTPLRPRYQNIVAATQAWLAPTLVAGETLRLDSLSEHGSGEAGVRARLIVPTSGTSQAFAGALGVDSHTRAMQWSDSDVMLCSIIGGAITCMSERQQTADRLLHEKLFTERLIDCLPGIFYVFDSDLRLLRWNKNFEAMGYSAQELHGKHLLEFCSTVDKRPGALATAQRILQGNDATLYWETQLPCKDGTLVPYLCSALRLDAATGPMLVGVGIDIAARQRAEEALAAASSAKDQFLAVLSHELRNPLAAIQAGIDLLRCLPLPEDPSARRAIEVIERNVKLQARLVNDLLDLSRLARGKLTVQRAPTRIDELVRSAVQACCADAVRAGLSIETHAESGQWVDADSDRIQQALINLIGNGIKFTPKGGRVTVRVHAAPPMVCVSVEDTGVGIETERLPDLFEMFRQVQLTTTRTPGLGIGLALVKSLVELNGGHVFAQSAGPGQGSRFTIELPLCEPPSGADAAPLADSGRRPISLLLIEDNNDARMMLGEALLRLGYRVISADSGEVALDLLAKQAVEVILSDIGLPGMDGYTFLDQARRLTTGANAAAFALTGYGQERDIEKAHAAGYLEHFVKPVDVEEIDRRIRAHLPP